MMQIYDPIHGYIELDGMFAHIVNTPEFQRLRSVEQGSFRPVFPGARHDRFAHSLGTYHLAKKFAEPFFRNLANDAGVVLPAKEQELLTRTFLYAALLHDIGHAPFSHTTEGFFEELPGGSGLPAIWDNLCAAVNQVNKDEGALFSALKKKCGAPHEIMSATVMVKDWVHFHRPDREGKYKPEVDLVLAARMVIGFTYSPEDLSKLKDQDVVTLGVRNCLIQMINYSLLDVDRLDYMGRDKLMSGFVNATVDLDCLAQSATAVGMGDAWVLWKTGKPSRRKNQNILKVWKDVGATLLKDQQITLPKGTVLEGSDAALETDSTYVLRENVAGLMLKEGTDVVLTESDGVALHKKMSVKLPKGTLVEDPAQPGVPRKLGKAANATLKADTRVQPDAWVLYRYEARPRLKNVPTLVVSEGIHAALAKGQVVALREGTALVKKDDPGTSVDKTKEYLLREDISGLELKKGENIKLTESGGIARLEAFQIKLPMGTAIEEKVSKITYKLDKDQVVTMPVNTLVRPDDVVDVKLTVDTTELMPDGTEKTFGARNCLKLRPSWLVPGYRDAALRVFDLMFQAKLSHDAWVLAAPAGAYDAALLAHCIRQLNGKIKEPNRKYMETIFTAKALSREGVDFSGKHYRLLSDVDIAADLKAQSGSPFDELYTRELGKRRIAAWRSYYEYHHIFNCPEMGLTPEKVYEFFVPLLKYLDKKHVFVFDKDAHELILGNKKDEDGNPIPRAADDVVRAAELLREFLRTARKDKKIDEAYNVVLLDRTSNFTMKLDPEDIRIVFSDHTRESKHLPLRSDKYNYSTYGQMTGVTAADKRAKPYFYIMRHHGLGHDQLKKLREMLAEELKK